MQLEWYDDLPGVPMSKVFAFIDELKTQPGRWAKYPYTRSAGDLAQKQRRYRGTEWTARRATDGKMDVFARWVADTSKAPVQ